VVFSVEKALRLTSKNETVDPSKNGKDFHGCQHSCPQITNNSLFAITQKLAYYCMRSCLNIITICWPQLKNKATRKHRQFQIRVLCFWTLSIVLFLSKTPSCFFYKQRFGDWIMSLSSVKHIHWARSIELVPISGERFQSPKRCILK
jgi:hypothetical protein